MWPPLPENPAWLWMCIVPILKGVSGKYHGCVTCRISYNFCLMTVFYLVSLSLICSCFLLSCRMSWIPLGKRMSNLVNGIVNWGKLFIFSDFWSTKSFLITKIHLWSTKMLILSWSPSKSKETSLTSRITYVLAWEGITASGLKTQRLPGFHWAS